VQIKISARHGHLSEATQAKIREKVDRLPRYYERVTSIEAIVDLEHHDKLGVELLVTAEPKHDFVAQETADELLKAVDAVVHKIEQQLRKYKERLRDPRA
jgi:putative sigma-54 modulation protein